MDQWTNEETTTTTTLYGVHPSGDGAYPDISAAAQPDFTNRDLGSPQIPEQKTVSVKALLIGVAIAAITVAALIAGYLLMQDSDPLTEYERKTLELDWAQVSSSSKAEVCSNKQFGIMVLFLAFDGSIPTSSAEIFWDEKC